MFKLEFLNAGRDNYQPFGSGLAFGTIGQPLRFRITLDRGPVLPVEIVVARDTEKKPLEFGLDMVDGTMKMTFYNPSPLPGTSGLIRPTPFIFFAGEDGKPWALLIMFTIDFLTSGDVYRFIYEFASSPAEAAASIQDAHTQAVAQ